MIPGDAIPMLLDPADVALAFRQNALVAHGGPGLALMVIALILALVVLVLALSTLEPRVDENRLERPIDAIVPPAGVPLLPVCTADELAPFATLKTAMLEYVEQRHAAQ